MRPGDVEVGRAVALDRAANDVAAVQQIQCADASGKVKGIAGIGPGAGQGNRTAGTADRAWISECATQIECAVADVDVARIAPGPDGS